MFIIKGIRKVEEDYVAVLENQENSSSMTVKIVPNAGGWAALGTEGECPLWEIEWVGADKSDISTWKEGDEIKLGNRIK